MTRGAMAGLIASYAMTRFHVALSGGGATGAEEPQSKKPVGGGDDAAMRAADEAAEALAGRRLTRAEKTQYGGPAVHYAFGAAAGAAYGAIAATNPQSVLARGSTFGAAVWLVADQLMLPLFGLSPWPLRAYPISTNLQHLASHVVYGATTETAFQLLEGENQAAVEPPSELQAAPY